MTLIALEVWCGANGAIVLPAGEVDEPTACRLLGFASHKALRRVAAEGRLSDALRHGRRRVGPRWLYSLKSIATHIELERDRYAVS